MNLIREANLNADRERIAAEASRSEDVIVVHINQSPVAIQRAATLLQDTVASIRWLASKYIEHGPFGDEDFGVCEVHND